MRATFGPAASITPWSGEARSHSWVSTGFALRFPGQIDESVGLLGQGVPATRGLQSGNDRGSGGGRTAAVHTTVHTTEA